MDVFFFTHISMKHSCLSVEGRRPANTVDRHFYAVPVGAPAPFHWIVMFTCFSLQRLAHMPPLCASLSSRSLLAPPCVAPLTDWNGLVVTAVAVMLSLSGVARICCEEGQSWKLGNGALTTNFRAGCSSCTMTTVEHIWGSLSSRYTNLSLLLLLLVLSLKQY